MQHHLPFLEAGIYLYTKIVLFCFYVFSLPQVIICNTGIGKFREIPYDIAPHGISFYRPRFGIGMLIVHVQPDGPNRKPVHLDPLIGGYVAVSVRHREISVYVNKTARPVGKDKHTLL